MRDNSNKKEKQKDRKEMRIFVKTFAIALIVVMVVSTPLFARVGGILDLTPGDPDAPVLEATIDFAELIPTDSPFFDAFINTNRVNILVLGVDNHNLTDTIKLVSFDVDNRFLDVISIPRDTYFFRGSGFIDRAHHKINAVWRGNSVNTAVAVSQILMNIPINYYVEVTYEGVENIINEIGGVPMHIERRMFYRDPFDSPPLVIDIPAGYQVLDGATSVHFLRYRGYADADLGRIRAQKDFLLSAARQSLSLNLPRIAESAFENVNSDMPLRTILFLATRAVGMDIENIRMHTMPIRNVDFFVHPDVEGIIELLTEIYSLEPFDIEEDEEESEEEAE